MPGPLRCDYGRALNNPLLVGAGVKRQQTGIAWRYIDFSIIRGSAVNMVEGQVST